MMNRNRREFLAEVGQGMLLASVGATLAADLGLAPAFAADGPERLTFGDREPLVALMQETPADKLLPLVVAKLKDGTDLKTLVAAAALANARTLGGHNYDGYHTFMALSPAWEMARELPEERRPLPVLKVLHRNARVIQGSGGGKHEMLHAVTPAALPKDRPGGEVLREATHKHDINAAERTFAALVHGSADDAFNDLLYSIQDEVNVHRVVLVWRAWATLDLAGKEQAHTLLRQSVHFCCTEGNLDHLEIHTLLPKLLDQYKLLGKEIGKRKADDAWIEKMAETIYGGGRTRAADAVAAALADGMSPEDIGEAMSVAANRLVLCDRGRQNAKDGKPIGSVHGDSVGVHASDSANAWRNIARVSNTRNTFASLICGAYHTAGQNGGQTKEPYQLAEQLEKIKAKDGETLLKEAEAAIKAREQARAAALIHRYGELKLPERPVFDLLLRYAVSEDGALHAEKYYRTVTEEFAKTREAFRWRQLVALARVTASECGYPAPGYAEACRLLKV
ncbi:MAG TPA: hypothetical protein VKA46_13295 [Gemmataceae bacterium]|nr:hypothetical protein [Gemmataceae bacterium]